MSSFDQLDSSANDDLVRVLRQMPTGTNSDVRAELLFACGVARGQASRQQSRIRRLGQMSLMMVITFCGGMFWESQSYKETLLRRYEAGRSENLNGERSASPVKSVVTHDMAESMESNRPPIGSPALSRQHSFDEPPVLRAGSRQFSEDMGGRASGSPSLIVVTSHCAPLRVGLRHLPEECL